MPWYIYALTAAVTWGIHYNFLARAMNVITPITAYWLPTLLMTIGSPLLAKLLYSDYQKVITADWKTQLAVCILPFTGFIASVCLYKAIQLHNPVHASLMEITFPLFVALFAFILFGQNHFNMGTILGGALIIVGAGVIIYTQ